MQLKTWLAAFLLASMPALAAEQGVWPDQAEIDRFIGDMKTRHDYPEADLRQMLAVLRPNEQVLMAIAPPKDPEAKSWHRYRARFVNPPRIDKGVEFWVRHRALLRRAEEAYGVPAPIIVAIIGVETEYGRNTGRFSVLEALATLAFAYPPRASYFRGELEEFLILARDNRLDPRKVTGSFAGAIGIPQFMPGSQRRFAVDFDGDGRIDLMRSVPDAIGSVARFLNLHGWEKGKPVAEQLPDAIEARPEWLAAGIKPSIELNQLLAGGLAQEHAPKQLPVALIDLATPNQATEFWWGHGNFYAITRYNRSSSYAMAVTQLASEIAQRAKQKDTDPSGVKAGSRASRHRAG